ncbi:MAG: hypothetical protein JO199_12810 [Candidatus Eremiobacteraeota bacterium]|nr:hypothetical protein [Candidatus Eremiobacteraeota bacterium]
MIRVRVPLDLHAVAAEGAAAFALATPLRVRELLALAVREAIGLRAPHDKFMRSVHRTLAGLAAGDFTVDIDGRTFADADDVVLCEGTAHVRFFVNQRRRAGVRR